MDERLRRLEREAATGDREALDRYRTACWRVGIPTGITPKKLVGPNGILVKAVRAMTERGDTPDELIRFAAAIAARHGTEFGCYCISAWTAENGNLPNIIRAARGQAESWHSNPDDYSLVARFLWEIKDALMPDGVVLARRRREARRQRQQARRVEREHQRRDLYEVQQGRMERERR